MSLTLLRATPRQIDQSLWKSISSVDDERYLNKRHKVRFSMMPGGELCNTDKRWCKQNVTHTFTFRCNTLVQWQRMHALLPLLLPSPLLLLLQQQLLPLLLEAGWVGSQFQRSGTSLHLWAVNTASSTHCIVHMTLDLVDSLERLWYILRTTAGNICDQ